MESVDGESSIVPRRIPPQNIVQRLLLRELHAGRRRRCNATITARIFFANVFPNYTVINVEKPACFLRKFSPDGRHLIAFSADQTSLEIYEFCGPAAAADMLNELPRIENAADFLPDSMDVPAATHVRSQLFSRFFKLTRVTCIAVSGESLNRECSLFTNDGRYVIVGSAVYVSDDQQAAPLFHDIYRNNESLCPNPRSPLEDCTLHIVSIDDGHVTDRRRFRCDKIYLSHNQGVYLYGATLAVLSVQQQTIHVFRISAEGSFVDVRTVGRFCYDDDLFVISSSNQLTNGTSAGSQRRPFHDVPINCLKHRLLVHLYRRTVTQALAAGTRKPVLSFFRHFDEFVRLRMWKMQLLDENHLLIRYASEEVCSLRAQDPNSQPSFFVVYDMAQAAVLEIFDGSSDDLLTLYEKFCDLLRYPAGSDDDETVALFASSPSSNVHARQAHERFKYSITGARYGGRTEAVRRVLAQLPISAQSYSTSPFLDLSLFSYDDKWVSAMERPKACGDHPIRFYARDSGLLKFKIHTGGVMTGRTLAPPANARRLVAFLFHPSQPFAISIQRTNAEYVVNFHVRHSPIS